MDEARRVEATPLDEGVFLIAGQKHMYNRERQEKVLCPIATIRIKT